MLRTAIKKPHIKHKKSMDTTLTHTGVRGFALLSMGEELFNMIHEARYAAFFLIVLILADFRFGRRESALRYKQAKAKGDTFLMTQYRWRTSKAIRRSMNKLLDYYLFGLLGIVIGVQFLDPCGIDRIWGTYGVCALITCVEIQSIISHFLYLHSQGVSATAVSGFLKRFAVSLAKRKNEDVGEALEDAMRSEERRTKSEE